MESSKQTAQASPVPSPAPSPAQDPQDADTHQTTNNADQRRVFVGNLAWRVRWQDLKDLMKEAGEVEYADVATSNGKSRGYGIVEFATAEGAARAIQDFQDFDFHERKIFVRYDRDEGLPRRRDRDAPRRVPAVTDETAGRQLHVANLPWSVTSKELLDLFGGNDRVELALVAADGTKSRGFGTVICHNEKIAEEAIQNLDGYEMSGRQIVVRIDNGPPPRTEGSGYRGGPAKRF